jgi:mannose-6-phosphate isomerase class I
MIFKPKVKLKIESHAFETIDWSVVPAEEHKGDTGLATWKVKKLNDIRVRRVEYSPGYKANHWCSKGHVLFCMEGEMDTELEDGRIFTLKKGMSYFVGDTNEPHRSSTIHGCKLIIVD